MRHRPGCGRKQRAALRACQRIDLAAKACGQARVVLLGGAVLRRRDRVADAHADAVARVAEHLADQQQRGEGLGEHRDAVEERRVAPVHEHRDDIGAGAARHAHEAAAPGAVAHAARAQARDLAGGKDHQRAAGAEVRLDAADVVARGATAHGVHRQQHRVQRLQRHQQLVGHGLHVGTDLVDQAQQRQAVEAADRVVRHDHHRAVRRDALALVAAHGVAEVEVLQHLVHEVHAAQVRVVLGELAEAAFVEQQAQHREQRRAQPAVLLRETGPARTDQVLDREHRFIS